MVDRRTVFIDLQSIAAGATVTQSVTITGSELVTPARALLLWPTQQVASAHRAYSGCRAPTALRRSARRLT